jgi:hypothetical protein
LSKLLAITLLWYLCVCVCGEYQSQHLRFRSSICMVPLPAKFSVFAIVLLFGEKLESCLNYGFIYAYCLVKDHLWRLKTQTDMLTK